MFARRVSWFVWCDLVDLDLQVLGSAKGPIKGALEHQCCTGAHETHCLGQMLQMEVETLTVNVHTYCSS